jgi:hypothetical protein
MAALRHLSRSPVIAMASDDAANPRLRFVKPLAGIGGRAAGLALRPVRGTIRVAAEVGMSAERRVVDRVLDSPELQRLPAGMIDDERVQTAVRGALGSDGATRIIGGFSTVVCSSTSSSGSLRAMRSGSWSMRSPRVRQ